MKGVGESVSWSFKDLGVHLRQERGGLQTLWGAMEGAVTPPFCTPVIRNNSQWPGNDITYLGNFLNFRLSKMCRDWCRIICLPPRGWRQMVTAIMLGNQKVLTQAFPWMFSLPCNLELYERENRCIGEILQCNYCLGWECGSWWFTLCHYLLNLCYFYATIYVTVFYSGSRKLDQKASGTRSGTQRVLHDCWL